MFVAPNTVRKRTTARADDHPVCHFSNAARLRVIDTVSVSEPGPPLVNRFTMSNILKFSIARNRIANIRKGITIGNVTDQKVRQVDARSTSAASYSESGMERKPARQISMT